MHLPARRVSEPTKFGARGFAPRSALITWYFKRMEGKEMDRVARREGERLGSKIFSPSVGRCDARIAGDCCPHTFGVVGL